MIVSDFSQAVATPIFADYEAAWSEVSSSIAATVLARAAGHLPDLVEGPRPPPSCRLVTSVAV